MPEIVRIGGRITSIDRAEAWVRSYFDGPANLIARKPYAYPAYDNLMTGSGPDELNDGDFLAPTLLNASPTIAAFFRLQSVRSQLEYGLRNIPTNLTLLDAVADGSVEKRLGDLVGVLDRQPLPGVRLTMLTKVLHRKRPMFVPLYDRFVYACYLGGRTGFPMQSDRKRSWKRFTCELGTCIARDLAGQSDTWQHLTAMAPKEVTTLRVLDVVAWTLGRVDNFQLSSSG